MMMRLKRGRETRGPGPSSGSGSSGPGSASDEDENGHEPGHPVQDRIPLKTVLQNFLNHVETLESRKGEEDCTYEKEFQQLKSFSDSLKTQPDFSCKEGELEVNRKKNRYKDILPFDSTRVLLSEYPGVPGSDYINANFIKGASGSNAYIASQGPLPHTVNDFWRMVVESEVQVIVMACNETEAGKHKCERYWCDGGDDKESCQAEEDDRESQFGKFFVKVLKMREICPDFSVRTMRLRWTSDDGEKEEERTVCQFHYSAWPDHGIPTQVKPLLEMVRLIRDCQASETLPVLVHCSAGCGRTGTICAIDFIWGLLRTGKLNSDFSLYELVKDMRRQRIAMVQTVDQYILVHRAVRELFEEQLRVIDSHPYENVDEEGMPIGRNDDDTPDYETIFIKSNKSQQHQDENDFDVILNQRMSKPFMGTAMLSRESKGLSKSDDNILSPPNPPTKQRSAIIDASAIDERKISYTNNKSEPSLDSPSLETYRKSSSERVIFEPPKPPNMTKDAAAQRFKKGNLRLTKADNGSWKLEELEDKTDKKGDVRKKKKGKEGEGESSRSELLRRPSIKKIRAFFNKDKENVRDAAPDSSEDSPQSDSEITSALAKLPKFEPQQELKDLSKSVPGSLDRKTRRDPDYANISAGSFEFKEIEKGNNNNSHYWKVGEANDMRPLAKSLSSSHSSEKLASFGRLDKKPTLPVKRSKSMKTITKSTSALPLSTATTTTTSSSIMVDENKPKFKKSSSSAEFRSLPATSHSHSRQSSLEERMERDLPPMSARRKCSVEYANVRMSDYIDSPKKLEDSGILTSFSSPDYANVRRGPDASREKKIEQQLLQLHARINSSTHKEDRSIPEDLKKSLPLIARSSDSLDSQAKRMLKDCQQYLMDSFTAAEREGDRLVRKPLKNRSAESSPMTTLQKSNAHLFSSHSSPSNSYNKYNINFGKIKSSPPGTIQKSVLSSPTGTIQKKYCSPAQRVPNLPSSPEDDLKSSATSFSPNHRSQQPASKQHYQNAADLGRPSGKGEIVAKEAQRKVNESSNFHKSKERRNSFREAVSNKGYESIWFEHDRQFFDRESNNNNNSKDSEEILLATTHEPTYVNARYSSKDTSPHQKAEPQQHRSRRSYEGDQPLPVGNGHYENISAYGESGYEPVNFKGGGMVSPTKRMGNSPRPLTSQQHQLQSVSLVSEVLNKQSSPPEKGPLVRQNSGNKYQMQPPPYKAPPQPQRTASQPALAVQPRHPNFALRRESEKQFPLQEHLQQRSFVQPPAQFSNQKRSPPGRSYASPNYSASNDFQQQQLKDNQDDAYVNVQVTKRQSRTTARSSSSKDDLAISNSRSKTSRRSTSQVVTNRYSLGDFSAYNPLPPPSLPANSNNSTNMHGVPMKRSPNHQSYIRISGGGEAPVNPLSPENLSLSPPGIDIDQLAAAMGQKKESSSTVATSTLKPSQGGRSLAGMFMGAAANVKSKLSHLSQQNNVNPSAQSSSQGFGDVFNNDSSNSVSSGVRNETHFNQASYPHRYESRPLGPRELPKHFQKKQEYL